MKCSATSTATFKSMNGTVQAGTNSEAISKEKPDKITAGFLSRLQTTAPLLPSAQAPMMEVELSLAIHASTNMTALVGTN